MLTLVFCFVVVVAIVKTFDTAPAGIKTVAGTFVRVALLVARLTTTPPAGAALVRVTVPLALEPPTTVVGLSVSEDSPAAIGGFTLNAADLLAPA